MIFKLLFQDFKWLSYVSACHMPHVSLCQKCGFPPTRDTRIELSFQFQSFQGILVLLTYLEKFIILVADKSWYIVAVKNEYKRLQINIGQVTGSFASILTPATGKCIQISVYRLPVHILTPKNRLTCPINRDMFD